MIGHNRALDVLLALNLIDELNFTLDNILLFRQYRCVKILSESGVNTT